jgi:hypothetical protein
MRVYLRILCPFVGPAIIQNGRTVGNELRSWHDVALANGRAPHRLMDVVGIGPDHRDELHGGHMPLPGLGPGATGAAAFHPGSPYRIGYQPGFCCGSATTTAPST